MAEFGYSLDQQSELDRLKRRREIALALQGQIAQPGVGMVGNRAVPTGRTEGIAKLAALLANRGNLRSADESELALQKRAQEESSSEVQRLMDLGDPTKQIAGALASKYPGIRQMGGMWQQQQATLARDAAKAKGERELAEFKALQDRLKGAGETRAKAGDWEGALNVFQTGGFAGGPIPGPRMPQFGQTADGHQTVINFDLPNNKATGAITQKPTQVSQTLDARQAADENKASLDMLETQLKPREERAQAALSTIDAVRTAVEAAERGAQAGGGQDVIQVFRKVGEAFGVDLPVTSNVDELQAALGEKLIGYLKNFAPVTEKEIKVAAGISGGINTSPDALSRLLAVGQALAMRELQTFNQFLGSQEQTFREGPARARVAGARVGRELPRQLFGPKNWQLEVVRQLHNRGGDVTGFGGLPEGFLEQLRSGQLSINPQLFGPSLGALPAPPPGRTFRRGSPSQTGRGG